MRRTNKKQLTWGRTGNSMKKLFSRTQFLYTLLFTLLAGVSNLAITPHASAQTVSPTEVSAYWDRGKIVAYTYAESSKNITCSAVKGRAAEDRIKRNIIRCLSNGGLPDNVVEALGELDPLSIDWDWISESNQGAYGSYSLHPKNDDIDHFYCSRGSCDITYHGLVPRTFIANGMDAVGEVVFLDSVDDDLSFQFNGVIQSTDGDGLDSLEGFNVIGRPSFSWDESAFYYFMEDQYDPLLSKYVDNCNGGEDCANTTERAAGAFTQIWRNCVVATGSIDADVQNAANCLYTHAGVKLNTSAIMENLPSQPGIFLDKDTCGISSAGYIICPVMRFIAGAADSMFQFMKQLMMISPLDPSDESGQNAIVAWRVFVNIANIVFAILLFIIVFSQLTSFGLDNYGIKRLLPRLLVGAVLVNASFYICIAAIDISNILGDSIQKVMIIINDEVTSATSEGIILSPDMDVARDNSSSWEGLSNAVLAAGVVTGGVAATVAIIFTFIPVMTAVILTAITVILILLVRYGLILLLTIISPIAFALYLLPNTQKWFTKWRTGFVSLLMLFPIVSAIFGLATLSANVVLQVASSQSSQTLALFALAIQSIPLAVTPILLRSSGQMLGNVGNTISNNGLFKKAKGMSKAGQGTLNKKAKIAMLNSDSPLAKPVHWYEKSKAKSQQRANTNRRKEAQYSAEFINGKAGSGGEKVSLWEKAKATVANRGLSEGDENYYTPKTAGEKMQRRMDPIGNGGGESRARGYALQTQHNLLTDEVKAQKKIWAREDSESITNAINNSTKSSDDSYIDTEKIAMAERAKEVADAESLRSIIERSGDTFTSAERFAARDSLGEGFGAHPTAQQSIQSGKVVDRASYEREVIQPNLLEGTFNAERIRSMAKKDASTIKVLSDASKSGNLSTPAQRVLRDAAAEAAGNSKVYRDLDHNTRRLVDEMAQMRVS